MVVVTEPDAPPLVAAIVVGTNDGRWLDACFASLTASNYPKLTLIYVDNGSTDDSLAIVARFPNVVMIANGRNLGFAESNNLGMRHAFERGAAHAFLINPDTRTQPDLIGALVEFLEAHPDYGIVGPLQAEYATGTPIASKSANAWTRHALENGERHAFHHWAPELPSEGSAQTGRTRDTLEHAYVQGATLAVRREVIERVGYLDPVYHTFYEEVDLCRRARWAGFRVALLTNRWIEHAGAHGGRPSEYRAFHMTRNKYLYLFTDPHIGGIRKSQIVFAWLLDDLTIQLPAETGLVSSFGQYIRVWLSLFSLAPYVMRTSHLNRLMAAPPAGTR